MYLEESLGNSGFSLFSGFHIFDRRLVCRVIMNSRFSGFRRYASRSREGVWEGSMSSGCFSLFTCSGRFVEHLFYVI